MRKIFSVLALACAATVVGCGGGGGSAGTSSGSDGTIVKNNNPVFKTASFSDSKGATTNSIGASGYTVLSVALTDPAGRPIANQIIDVAGDDKKVIFPEGSSGLTNAAGIASIKVARASLVATGAGSLTVTYSYKVGAFLNYPDGSPAPTVDTVIATYVGYELATANIALVNFDVGAPSLPAYGTRQLSVQANVNGSPTTTPVQVNFTATCGQVSPTTASTDSSGKISVSYSATDAADATQSTQGCSGKAVEISASAIGAAVTTKTINIEVAPATSIGFDSVSPARIYLANAGSPNQAVVQFKLVNARGESLRGQDVRLTLKTLNGGLPKAFIGNAGNTDSVVTTTDADGKVSVPVFSGTVPTNVIVNAALVSNPLVQTDSAVLAIASGRPAQARVSLSIKALSIEGFNVDGTETNVTMSLADRQGNPVPDGTAVNFVTEGGVMIPPVCTTGTNFPGDSQCAVKIRSQSPRPTDGRVTIFAYVAGEEDFVDANYNNVYDRGERFDDLVTAFRDDNDNNTFDDGEFSVPRAAEAGGTTPSPNQGDGVWGAADVRGKNTIVFATSDAVITVPNNKATTTGVNFVVADLNGNSMPTGSVITVKVVDNTPGSSVPTGPAVNGITLTISTTCTVGEGATAVVPNTLAAFPWVTSLKDCTAGDKVAIEVKTPGGRVTSKTVDVQ